MDKHTDEQRREIINNLRKKLRQQDFECLVERLENCLRDSDPDDLEAYLEKRNIMVKAYRCLETYLPDEDQEIDPTNERR